MCSTAATPRPTHTPSGEYHYYYWQLCPRPPHAKLISRPYQYLAVDSKLKAADTRLYIEQVLAYRGQAELLREFQLWTTPRFGVTGNHLKEAGCPPGKVMSVVLGRLKEEWKEKDFKIEVNDLVKRIPVVLDSIGPTELQALSPPRSKKSKTKTNL